MSSSRAVPRADAKAEAEAAYVGAADNEEYSGRCAAILSNGKRCPNAALPGSRYCGVPAHQALAAVEHERHEDQPEESVDGAEAPEAAPVEAPVAPGDELEMTTEESE